MNDFWHSEHNGNTRCGAMYDLLEPSSLHGVITIDHAKVTCPYCIAALPTGYEWTDEQKTIMVKEADRHQPCTQAVAVMPDATPGEEPRVNAIYLEACQWGQGKPYNISMDDVLFLVRRLRETRSERQASYLALMEVLGKDRIGCGSMVEAIQNLIDHNTHLRGKAVELQERLGKPTRIILVDDPTFNDSTYDLVLCINPISGRPSVLRGSNVNFRTKMASRTHTELDEKDIELIAKIERKAQDDNAHNLFGLDEVRALIKCRDYWFEQHANQANAAAIARSERDQALADFRAALQAGGEVKAGGAALLKDIVRVLRLEWSDDLDPDDIVQRASTLAQRSDVLERMTEVRRDMKQRLATALGEGMVGTTCSRMVDKAVERITELEDTRRGTHTHDCEGARKTLSDLMFGCDVTWPEIVKDVQDMDRWRLEANAFRNEAAKLLDPATHRDHAGRLVYGQVLEELKRLQHLKQHGDQCATAADTLRTQPEVEYTEPLDQYANRIGRTVGVHRKVKR